MKNVAEQEFKFLFFRGKNKRSKKKKGAVKILSGFQRDLKLFLIRSKKKRGLARVPQPCRNRCLPSSRRPLARSPARFLYFIFKKTCQRALPMLFNFERSLCPPLRLVKHFCAPFLVHSTVFSKTDICGKPSSNWGTSLNRAQTVFKMRDR